jgi:hypothetical protein
MEAFRVSAPLADMLETYPSAEQLIKAATDGGEASKIAIARLWLSEGIPFAFRTCPGVYESARTWLSVRLNVDPKEINITGSARIGQSLAPQKNGAIFGRHSDLDLFIVSSDLFERIRNDFNAWSYHFESGQIVPSNDRERGFWVDNNQRGPKIIQRGFMDSKIVPNRDEYPTIKNIAQTMWLIKKKLDVTEAAPEIKNASVRCYRSWNDYVRQTVLSLTW